MLERISNPKRSDIERLKNIIVHKLRPMVERNSSRVDLQQRFQELVEQYNLGAYTAEAFFEELKQFVHDLETEAQRTVREGLSEEELAIFDLLCQEVPLSESERNKVKDVAKELLAKLQAVLVIDWRKRQRTKARVESMIKDVLDELPDAYADDVWPKACEDVYLHIFDKYAGEGHRV